ncbi:VOC family protein [Bradyrhizobium sp. 6(2017)]|uniref:VOC family protein n=1 Tax=Bradyrhizobium sp. 6(2017) TaxID=1197460 RepID=UPI0013E111A3|nr:VOC family protein [Bradyrhizobium sp. 6(2017)]
MLVRDLASTSDRCAALGFAPRPLGRHPWGTCMQFVQFDVCSIELMSLYDETLIDQHAVDGFSFGRYIRDQLHEREGKADQCSIDL